MGPEDDQFLLDTERNSPFVKQVFQNGTESMREGMIRDILYYKQRGISPEQTAIELTRGNREMYMALDAMPWNQ